MSDDIVKQLRDIQHRFIFQGNSEFALSVASEIERLRARVKVLETALRHYADDAYNGYNGSGACARAALKEAKP